MVAPSGRAVEASDRAVDLDFSLVDGGPLRQLTRALGLMRAPLGGLGPGVALAVFTWLPLLVLTLIQAVVVDGRVTGSFLGSVSSHTRLLVAIPLFFAAEAWIDPRLRHFVQHLVDARIVPPSEVGALEAAVRTASRLRDSVLAEAVILALVAAFATAGVRLEQPADAAYWRAAGGGTLTPGGWWYVAVALPVFQFLVGRWLWRLVIWWWFLWRLSRLDLQLVAVHPDLSGGLGHLGVVESHFGSLSLATSATFAGTFVEEMRFGAVPVEHFLLPVLGIVALNLALFLGPLLFFEPRLLAVKRQGFREYGLLGTTYVRSFQAKWIRGAAPPHEPLLGSGDIQSLADLANAFDIVRRMRVVPIGLGLVLALVAASLAPLLPLLLVAFPLDELIRRLVTGLLGV